MIGGAQEALRAQLLTLGFDEVRFATVEPAREARALRDWLDEGMHADMEWMSRTAGKRTDPELVLAGAKSVILLGVNYWRTEPPRDPSRPVWARYALHEDYHDTIKPALVAAGRLLESDFGLTGTQYRYYVDAGPVLERGWAARAGVGFLGKNAMLISRRHGNWLLLAAIFTPLEFQPDEPVRKAAAGVAGAAAVGLLCGKCTRCLDACPTQAFPRPGLVDARRCISYQTIENRGIIPRELRAGIGARIYGCDVCLEVCPWNRFAQEGRRALLVARDELANLALADILTLTPERYAQVFRRTPIKRVKLAGLLRNACIVAANTGATEARPLLVSLARHASPVVRAHAVWAVFRLGAAGEAESVLAAARAAETDPVVLAEYAAEEENRPAN
jgi:epoxyqueuosine reductase